MALEWHLYGTCVALCIMVKWYCGKAYGLVSEQLASLFYAKNYTCRWIRLNFEK